MGCSGQTPEPIRLAGNSPAPPKGFARPEDILAILRADDSQFPAHDNNAFGYATDRGTPRLSKSTAGEHTSIYKYIKFPPIHIHVVTASLSHCEHVEDLALAERPVGVFKLCRVCVTMAASGLVNGARARRGQGESSPSA